jgi:hypothetical protein
MYALTLRIYPRYVTGSGPARVVLTAKPQVCVWDLTRQEGFYHSPRTDLRSGRGDGGG